jgi:hypothetical protein
MNEQFVLVMYLVGLYLIKYSVCKFVADRLLASWMIVVAEGAAWSDLIWCKAGRYILGWVVRSVSVVGLRVGSEVIAVQSCHTIFCACDASLR